MDEFSWTVVDSPRADRPPRNYHGISGEDWPRSSAQVPSTPSSTPSPSTSARSPVADGIMYVLAFLAFVWLGRLRLRHGSNRLDPAGPRFISLVRAVSRYVGGRLGEVLLFEPVRYFANPLEIVQVWKGGMAFHGGRARCAGGVLEHGAGDAPHVPQRGGLLRADGSARPRVRAVRQLHQRRTAWTALQSGPAVGDAVPPGRCAAAAPVAALPVCWGGVAAVRPAVVVCAAPAAGRGGQRLSSCWAMGCCGSAPSF